MKKEEKMEFDSQISKGRRKDTENKNFFLSNGHILLQKSTNTSSFITIFAY
tara:strand:+ start:79 stop:231 length:153 start_codon:yes stop_codon:yes gene_type:complete